MWRPPLSWQPFSFRNTGQSDGSILHLPLSLGGLSCETFILVDFELQLGIANSQPTERVIDICGSAFPNHVFPGQTALFLFMGSQLSALPRVLGHHLGEQRAENLALHKKHEAQITWACPRNWSRSFHPSARVSSMSRCPLNPPWLLHKVHITFGIPVQKSKQKSVFFLHQTLAWRAVPPLQHKASAVCPSRAEGHVPSAAGVGTQSLSSVLQMCCDHHNICSERRRFFCPSIPV